MKTSVLVTKLTEGIPEGSLEANSGKIIERLLDKVFSLLNNESGKIGESSLIVDVQMGNGNPIYHHSPFNTLDDCRTIHQMKVRLALALTPRFEKGGQVLDWDFLRNKFPKVDADEVLRNDWLNIQLRKNLERDGVIKSHHPCTEISIGGATTVPILNTRERLLLAVTGLKIYNEDRDKKLIQTASNMILRVNSEFLRLIKPKQKSKK